MAETVAFLGTGIMGAHMARHIARGGRRVRAWNRTREKAKALAGDQVVACDQPSQAVRGARAVVLMLSDGPVCDMVLGEMGVYDAMEKAATLIVMSSIDVASAKGQADRCSRLGLGYVDAPVSGGEKGAKEATLAIMAGGSDRDYSGCAGLLSCMGRPVHVGGAGTGQLAKLVNQTIVALTIMAVAESFMLAEAGGADLSKVREALSGGFADSTVLRQHALRMIKGDYRPGGPAKHQLKDLRGALASARQLGVDLPMLREAEKAFGAFIDAGGGDMDHSGIYAFMRGEVGGGR